MFLMHEGLALGEGGTSKVSLGLRADGTPVALKRYNSERDTGEETLLARAFKAEVESLKVRTAIPGIVHYVGSCEFTEEAKMFGATTKLRHRAVALELMEFSLTDVVVHWCKRGDVMGSSLHFEAVQYVGGSVLRTLLDLIEHDPDSAAMLVHRDLKPDNILFDRMARVRLIDFGLVSRDVWRSFRAC